MNTMEVNGAKQLFGSNLDLAHIYLFVILTLKCVGCMRIDKSVSI